jgi:hypothetical protein
MKPLRVKSMARAKIASTAVLALVGISKSIPSMIPYGSC